MVVFVDEEMAERAKEQERREKESHMKGTLAEDDLPPQVQAAWVQVLWRWPLVYTHYPIP